MLARFGLIVAISAAGAAACRAGASTDPASDGHQTNPAGATADGGSAPADSRVGSTSTATPPPPPTMFVSTETITVGDSTRFFVLAVPSSYTPQAAYPLILALHGDALDGPSMREALHFESVSGQGAFVAYPTGTSKSWDLYAPADQDADVTFITALVDSLRARFNIPATKVFAIGMSSGAFMVNQLACRRSSLFRGIVSHSGGAPSEPNDPTATTWGNGYVRCAGQTTGPAVMVIHGTADPTVAWESGDHSAKYWAFVNGCQSTRADATPAPCVRHDACPVDKPVLFCPIANLGHALWADAVTTSWAFFSAL